MNCVTIASVVSQHAEEASFLWHLRSLAVHQPHYALKDLRKLDLRVEAHLDGLRIAGEHGWEICRDAMAIGEPGELFAAASLAFDSGDPQRIALVRRAAIEIPANAGALASALGWMSWAQAARQIAALLVDDSPILRRAGIAACAIHRPPGAPPETPLFNRALASAVVDDDAPLRARALRAVGELGLTGYAPSLERGLGDASPTCRFSAAYSGLVLGIGAAIPVVRQIAESDSDLAPIAGALAARRLFVKEANTWRTTLAARPTHRRTAVTIAAALGDPAAIPWLVDLMPDPALARLAGEAFTSITGADLALLDLEADAPEGFNAGPTEDPEDENVAMDPDEYLPWPDQALIKKWWSANSSRFAAGQRYLLGQVMTDESLRDVLRRGRQRHRAAAALELAMRSPGSMLFEVRARGDRQAEALGVKF